MAHKKYDHEQHDFFKACGILDTDFFEAMKKLEKIANSPKIKSRSQIVEKFEKLLTTLDVRIVAALLENAGQGPSSGGLEDFLRGLGADEEEEGPAGRA